MSVGRIDDFALERYFARWEFAVDHQLSASDVEPLTMAEVLAMADADSKARWDRLALNYTESAGLPALRAEIASMYERVEPSGVLVFAGAEEAIYLTMLALLGPDVEAVVVAPAYQSLFEVGRAAGARVHLVSLEFERGFELDVGAIERAITPRTRLIVVNFPHNPTGAHISRTTQRRLVEIANDAGAVLFSDEVYRGLESSPDDSLPPAADLSATALSLGVMSKSLALPGLRIGWLATRNAPLLDRIARLKDYTTICSSAPSEILALAALRARDRILERSRGIVKANVETARRFMAAHADAVEWVPPRAGSIALPRFRSLSADAVSTQLAEQHSVLLMPGSVFGVEQRHFRLGLGRKDFPAALDALGRVLKIT